MAKGSDDGSGFVGDFDLDLGLGECPSWGDVDAVLLAKSLGEITDLGARLTFGVMSKSSTLSIQVYYDNQPHVFYPPSIEAGEQALRQLPSKIRELKDRRDKREKANPGK